MAARQGRLVDDDACAVNGIARELLRLLDRGAARSA